MKVIGCDPGTTESAFVLYDSDEKRVLQSVTCGNDVAVAALEGHGLADNHWGWLIQAHRDGEKESICLAIEKVEAMGMAVGATTFETVFWTGRFYQAWPHQIDRITRRQVKLNLCHNMRAKDANIRQALIDRIGPQGTMKLRGPLYGVHGHEFSALAVGVTWLDMHGA